MLLATSARCNNAVGLFGLSVFVIVNSNTAASSICGIGGFAMLHRTANRLHNSVCPIFGLSGTLRHSERLGSLTCQKSACECTPWFASTRALSLMIKVKYVRSSPFATRFYDCRRRLDIIASWALRDFLLSITDPPMDRRNFCWRNRIATCS